MGRHHLSCNILKSPTVVLLIEPFFFGDSARVRMCFNHQCEDVLPRSRRYLSFGNHFYHCFKMFCIYASATSRKIIGDVVCTKGNPLITPSKPLSALIKKGSVFGLGDKHCGILLFESDFYITCTPLPRQLRQDKFLILGNVSKHYTRQIRIGEVAVVVTGLLFALAEGNLF